MKSPKLSAEGKALLLKWQGTFGIADWVIDCEPIAEMQVVDALCDNTPGHEFVGIAMDFECRKATIYHTRQLMEDDIIHELLHVRYPHWSEDEVNCCTGELMVKRSNKLCDQTALLSKD